MRRLACHGGIVIPWPIPHRKSRAHTHTQAGAQKSFLVLLSTYIFSRRSCSKSSFSSIPHHAGHNPHYPSPDSPQPQPPTPRMERLLLPSLPACKSFSKLLHLSPPMMIRPKPSTSSPLGTVTPPLAPALPPALLLLPPQQDDVCLAVCQSCI